MVSDISIELNLVEFNSIQYTFIEFNQIIKIQLWEGTC
jgi:hypothetical protein